MLANSGKADISTILQFGAGFLTSYLVSEKIVVRSKNNNDEQWVWTSTGAKTFDISRDPYPYLKRGTEIELHLREDSAEYTDEKKIITILKPHYDLIRYGVYIYYTEKDDEKMDQDEPTEDYTAMEVDEWDQIETIESKLSELSTKTDHHQTQHYHSYQSNYIYPSKKKRTTQIKNEHHF